MSISKVTQAAEQGDADAQTQLGIIYYQGVRAPRNDAEAIKWLTKAAEQDHLIAQFFLGIAYYEGVRIPKDFFEAVKWLRKSRNRATAMRNSAWAVRIWTVKCPQRRRSGVHVD